MTKLLNDVSFLGGRSGLGDGVLVSLEIDLDGSGNIEPRPHEFTDGHHLGLLLSIGRPDGQLVALPDEEYIIYII